MGTGCDTIMAQIAADCLETPMENIVVFSVDTDISPYDSGSYASSTTYTTGVAVMKACQELRKKICELGAQMIEVDQDKWRRRRETSIFGTDCLKGYIFQ